MNIISQFQNDNSKLVRLEHLLDVLLKEYQLQRLREDTQRVNPTGSELDTTRRDRSSNILSFEEITLRRAQKVALKECNRILDEILRE